MACKKGVFYRKRSCVSCSRNAFKYSSKSFGLRIDVRVFSCRGKDDDVNSVRVA